MRKVVRLVESTPEAAPWMKRHGDDRVRPGEDWRTCRPHHAGQRDREAAAPFVLERVDDLAERAFVEARGARGIDEAGDAAAARARLERGANHPP
jgi:hypothetical protein